MTFFDQLKFCSEVVYQYGIRQIKLYPKSTMLLIIQPPGRVFDISRTYIDIDKGYNYGYLIRRVVKALLLIICL